MATPMTPAQIEAQLKRWGIRYLTPFSNWKTHNRDDETGKAFGPVHGMLWHHTGADNTTSKLLHDGISGLPGPLCQLSIDPQGNVVLIGWGRANHAGGGDPASLQHVIKEDYTGELKPKFGEGDSGAADGNDSFYGVEIVYSGSHGMTAAQYSTAVKLSAAIAEHHKWGARSFIGHFEWNKYKWDPGYAPGKHMDMNAVRSDIDRAIKAGPGGIVTTPVPGKDVEASKPSAYKDVMETDAIPAPRNHPDYAENKFWTTESYLRFIAEKLINLGGI